MYYISVSFDTAASVLRKGGDVRWFPTKGSDRVYVRRLGLHQDWPEQNINGTATYDVIWGSHRNGWMSRSFKGDYVTAAKDALRFMDVQVGYLNSRI